MHMIPKCYINTLNKGMNFFILSIMAWIVTLLSFYRDSFGIK